MSNIINQFATDRMSLVGSGDDLNEGALTDAIVNIVNIVIGILGFICVAVIIIGGVGYMTSSGDPGKVKKAKDTILYGIIGLVICALAFAIVNFVINNVINEL